MRLLKKMLAILPMMTLFCLNGHASICDSTSLALMEQTWKEFRAVHPFGFQTVGLRKVGGDTYVFVMSEPAEWVKSKELESLFTKYDGNLIIGRKAFGYDGGLYDAIGCAKLNKSAFKIFESELFKILYGTDYKPYYTDLSKLSPHVYYSSKKLNYSLKPSFFLDESYVFNMNWLVEMLVTLSQTEKGKLMSPDTMLYNLSSSPQFADTLCYSKERGFVIWVIDPRYIDYSDNLFRENARRFTLDTDLILTAFYMKGAILLVGREREIPVTILPPLRSETIRLLASLDDQDFSVSISPASSEDFIEDGKWSRQITMSEKLRDTELGNLLTQAGVLLFSLSEHATVRDYFIDYPLPPKDKFKSGITHQMGDSIQYLWKRPDIYRWHLPDSHNLCQQRVTNLTITLLNETGSLKPCYQTFDGKVPENSKNVGEKAYNLFTSLNNTDLVRTAQYALVHQAFILYKRYNKYNYYPRKRESRDYMHIRNEDRISEYKDSWVQTPSLMVLNSPHGSIGYKKGEEIRFNSKK